MTPRQKKKVEILEPENLDEASTTELLSKNGSEFAGVHPDPWYKSLFRYRNRRDVSLFWMEKWFILLHSGQLYALLWILYFDYWPHWWLVWTRNLLFFNLDYATWKLGFSKEMSDIRYNRYASFWVFAAAAVIGTRFLLNYLFVAHSRLRRNGVLKAHCFALLNMFEQAMYMPLTWNLSRFLFCDNETHGMVGFNNPDKCWENLHLTVYLFCLLSLCIVALWPVIRWTSSVKSQVVSDDHFAHERFVQQKEYEYLLNLNEHWMTGRFYLFSSYTSEAVYRSVYISWCKMIASLIVAYANRSMKASTMAFSLALLVPALKDTLYPPYRCSSTNRMHYIALWSLIINVFYGTMKIFEIPGFFFLDSNVNMSLRVIDTLATCLCGIVLIQIALIRWKLYIRSTGVDDSAEHYGVGEVKWPVTDYLAFTLETQFETWIKEIRSAARYLEDAAQRPKEFIDVQQLAVELATMRHLATLAHESNHILSNTIDDLIHDLVDLYNAVRGRSLLEVDDVAIEELVSSSEQLSRTGILPTRSDDKRMSFGTIARSLESGWGMSELNDAPLRARPQTSDARGVFRSQFINSQASSAPSPFSQLGPSRGRAGQPVPSLLSAFSEYGGGTGRVGRGLRGGRRPTDMPQLQGLERRKAVVRVLAKYMQIRDRAMSLVPPAKRRWLFIWLGLRIAQRVLRGTFPPEDEFLRMAAKLEDRGSQSGSEAPSLTDAAGHTEDQGRDRGAGAAANFSLGSSLRHTVVDAFDRVEKGVHILLGQDEVVPDYLRHEHTMLLRRLLQLLHLRAQGTVTALGMIRALRRVKGIKRRKLKTPITNSAEYPASGPLLGGLPAARPDPPVRQEPALGSLSRIAEGDEHASGSDTPASTPSLRHHHPQRPARPTTGPQLASPSSVASDAVSAPGRHSRTGSSSTLGPGVFPPESHYDSPQLPLSLPSSSSSSSPSPASGSSSGDDSGEEDAAELFVGAGVFPASSDSDSDSTSSSEGSLLSRTRRRQQRKKLGAGHSHAGEDGIVVSKVVRGLRLKTSDFVEVLVRYVCNYGFDPLQELNEAFALLDQEGNGRLSTKELRSGLKGLKEDLSSRAIRHIISEADMDADGYVSLQDFRTMMMEKVDDRFYDLQ
eukprot:Rmarinus@m.15340